MDLLATLRATLPTLPRKQAIDRLRAYAPQLDLADRFQLLDELGIYHGAESRSGDGSSQVETHAFRAALPDLLRRHDVRRLVDAPCGDFHWMRLVDLDGVDYLGADIVADIVAANQARYKSSSRAFRHLDLTRDPLPKADLVLCRDLLIHLSLGAIQRVLANVVTSGARLLLTSHYTSCETNDEIVSGDFHEVNLCRPPFLLPPPIEVINERSAMADGRFHDRAMALWRVADLTVAACPANPRDYASDITPDGSGRR